MSAIRSRISLLLIVAALAAGCGKAPQQHQQMPPAEVGVVTAKAQAVPLTRDLVGRLSATRTADVRARIAGVLQKRVYTEGTDVKEGQLLFQIDPAPLQAALNAQQANLAAAQATWTNNNAAAERARKVADKGLLSKTDVDNALAAERTSAAAVKQAQANVALARINLGYASVTAPIAGRAGQQQVTEGALVGQGEATLLTTIDQIDPLYVNFSQAVGELDLLKRAVASGAVADGRPEQGEDRTDAARWQRLRRKRHARFLRCRGRCGDRRGHAARRRAESRPSPAARHVRQRAPDHRRAEACVAGAAGCRAARRARRLRVRRGPGRQGRAEADQDRCAAGRRLDRQRTDLPMATRSSCPACRKCSRVRRQRRRHGKRPRRTAPAGRWRQAPRCRRETARTARHKGIPPCPISSSTARSSPGSSRS